MPEDPNQMKSTTNNSDVIMPPKEKWSETIYKVYQKVQSQGESQPERRFQALGLEFVIYKGVFAPDIFYNSIVFAEKAVEIVQSLQGGGMQIQKFLEMGCGAGPTAVNIKNEFSFEVSAADINPQAVANTKENARLNKLEIETYQSDCFDSIPLQSFDIMAWWIPYNPVDAPGTSVDPELIKGGYDPQYKSLDKFLSQAGNYLSENGLILLGIGANVVNNTLIKQLATKNGWEILEEPLAEFEIPLEIGTTEPLINTQIIGLRRAVAS